MVAMLRSLVSMETSTTLRQAIEYFESRKDVYARCYFVSTVLTIGLSLLVTISGILQWKLVAPCLGAALTAIIAIERAFSFGDKLAFYKQILGEAQTLEWDVQPDDSETTRAGEKKRLKELWILAANTTRGADLTSGLNRSSSGFINRHPRRPRLQIPCDTSSWAAPFRIAA
jgi:hypothetical protein